MLLREAEEEEEEEEGGHSSNDESTGMSLPGGDSAVAPKTEKELRKEVTPCSFRDC